MAPMSNRVKYLAPNFVSGTPARCCSLEFMHKKCRLSRENLNSTFSGSYIKIITTYDALDRFQENKVFQTAQTMNNILNSNTKW